MSKIIDAVTETGSRYRIDFERGLWFKIRRDGARQGSERLWSLQVGTELKWPWDAPDSWEDATLPEVGKHLYIAGKELWYASTPIVEIREVTWGQP